MPTPCNPVDICGIPVDAEYFDVSGFLETDKLPRKGERAVLASFQIHPQYCGVLEAFTQFTDLFIFDNSRVDTPGLEWIILRNGQPLFPYNKIEAIVNPWGYAYYAIQIRLDENARLEFVLYNRSFDHFLFGAAGESVGEKSIGKVGGRLIGRYWYNEMYGNLPHSGRSMAHI